jgi:hypothetical protein
MIPTTHIGSPDASVLLRRIRGEGSFQGYPTDGNGSTVKRSNPMATIPIVVEARDEIKSGTLGLAERVATTVKNFDTAELRKAFTGLVENLSAVFADLRQVGGFELKEVQVSVEVGAEGGVSLLGTVKASAGGAITLTFSP